MGQIEVRVQPRASREEIVGWSAGALRVRVTSPPVGGEANEAVRKLIAKRLGVAKRGVTIVRGARGREKLVRVEGVSAAEMEARFGGG